MDVTDIIDYNVSILNPNDPSNACSCLAKHHPTVGFPYHPTRLTGHVHPKTVTDSLGKRPHGLSPWRLAHTRPAPLQLRTARLTPACLPAYLPAASRDTTNHVCHAAITVVAVAHAVASSGTNA